MSRSQSLVGVRSGAAVLPAGELDGITGKIDHDLAQTLGITEEQVVTDVMLGPAAVKRFLEADEVGLKWHLAAALLVEQHADAHAGRPQPADHRGDEGEGFPGVEDIVHDQDMAAGNIQREAVDQLGGALRLGGAAVAGGADAVEADGVVHLA